MNVVEVVQGSGMYVPLPKGWTYMRGPDKSILIEGTAKENNWYKTREVSIEFFAANGWLTRTCKLKVRGMKKDPTYANNKWTWDGVSLKKFTRNQRRLTEGVLHELLSGSY